jgi:hypothetical protein
MDELVFDGDSISVPMVPPSAKCHVFQEYRALIARAHYEVSSRVSMASFRVFSRAIKGSDAEITDGNARDIALLSGELKLAYVQGCR